MHYPLFFSAGEICEIRAIGLSGKNPGWEGFAKSVVSGYYDNAEAFAAGAGILEKAKAPGVYHTLNPANPALIARAANRLKVPKATTQDNDIVCVRWLPIDLDPKRPADISSTDAELAAAVDMAHEIAAWMEGDLGFSRAIRAKSGNGCHLLYRLDDLPNDEATHALIVAAIAAIRAKFDNAQVDIDVSVVNPARIWKCYGTTGRKGDATPDRPHRKSALFPDQPLNLADVPVTDIAILRELASLAPGANGVPSSSAVVVPATSANPSRATAVRFPESTLGPLDVGEYLTHYGVAYTEKEKGARTLYCLDHCVFNADHTDATIIASPTGPLMYHCFHNSCKGKVWKDAKLAISGNDSLAKFCAGYDPDWKPPKNAGSGAMGRIEIKSELAVESAASVDPPEKIDPTEFFEVRGKRPVFVPMFLARYLTAYLSPIVHTAGGFWRYAEGIWKPFADTILSQIMVATMKDRVQADMMANTLKILRGLINREEDAWPQDVNLINVQNGMLDIQTMELRPHDPKYGSRTQLPVNYTPGAFSQRWWDFLEDIFPNDQNYARRGLLQQFFGYCLLRDCRYQKALFMYGTGANGKSTVLDVLQAMVGRDNTSSLSLTDLTQRFKTQFLREKLINIATETNTRDPLSTELLKAIISGDPITAEQKYGEQFQFRPYAKFISAMNDAPVIPDKSYGFGRRIIVLSFERRFLDDEIKPRMAQHLIEEIDGIFNWTVEGLAILLKNDAFLIPEMVNRDTADFMETLNPLLIFVNEMCVVHDKASVPTMELWECYAEWCADGKNRPLGRNRFLDQVRQTFPRVKSERDKESRVRTLSGIGLTNAARQWTQERKSRFTRSSGRRED